MEKISFRAKDGVEIIGLFDESAGAGTPAVLLLHMMPAVKESWKEFQEKLAVAGFQSLAIDLRGHGESTTLCGTDAERMRNERGQIQKLDYRNFSDEEHQKSILDVEAAVDFLLGQGIELKNICLAGASIGANLALQYQSKHLEIKASVLLSSGLDYCGLKTEPLAENISENQSVYLAGATEDDHSSGQSCADMTETLFNLLKSKNKKLKIIEGKEHGTDMFRADSEMMDEIIGWLRKIYFKDL